MNFQTPKPLSPPSAFLKRRDILPVTRKRKNTFCIDYTLNGKLRCVNFVITRILRVTLGNASLGHSKLIYDELRNEVCKFNHIEK